MRELLMALALTASVPPVSAQSMLERTPNLAGAWTLQRGHAAFVFTHRFEFVNGGDELFNIPTLTLAVGLPLGLTAGLDYSSNSEVVPGHTTGNETEFWLKRALPLGRRTAVAAIAGYNTAAHSVDGALSGRQDIGWFSVLGELRGFSDQFGSGDPGGAGAVGAILRLTPYLGIEADVGRVFSPDSIPAIWSAGVAVAIPGSPHTLSLQATNGGATTLQGASREKVIGQPDHVRYGFVFTVPLGNGSTWGRIFHPAPKSPAVPVAGPDSIAARVDIRMIAFQPAEIRIRAGQSVEWSNRDPIQHTVTGKDGSWGSELLNEGQRYVHRFATPGRYPYYCTPHPQMTGVVIVEP